MITSGTGRQKKKAAKARAKHQRQLADKRAKAAASGPSGKAPGAPPATPVAKSAAQPGPGSNQKRNRKELDRQTPATGARAAGQALKDHSEIFLLVAIVVAIQLFPGTMPAGIYGLGIVSGASLVLHAAGVILIYRSNRIVNFAQVQVGVVAAALFTVLVQYRPLLRAYNAVCPGCAVTPTLVDVNYWLSLALGMGFALLLAYSTYFFVIKRFSAAPRLIVTVATIFIAQLLGGIQGVLPNLLSTADQRLAGSVILDAPKLPFEWNLSWNPIKFSAPQILIVLIAAAAVIGITLWSRLSSTGIAVRAAGESPRRAETLGVPVTALHGRVWLISGALSGAAGMVVAMSGAPLGTAALDVETMIRILVVAVIARMASLPLASAAGVIVAVLLQSIVFSYGSNVMLNVVLFGILAATLLLQTGRLPPELAQASSWRAAREVRPVPRELNSLAIVRNARIGVAAIIAVGVLGLPWALSGVQTSLASVALIYAMIGLSLLVVTGWTGHISLGQFAFAAVGAYAVGVLEVPFVLALPLGALAGAVAGVLVGIPALRLRGLHLAVITLGFAMAVPIALLNPTYLGRFLPQRLNRPAGIGLDLDDPRTYYYVCLLILGLAVGAVVGLRRSRTARALIAGRDNEPAARSFGISLARARLDAYAISGALAGLAGVLYAYHQGGVRAGSFPPELSVTLFMMAVIGGLGAVSAPLIGALYVGALLVFSASPVVTFLATGGGGLALLLFFPGGLAQLLFGLRDSWLRRLAVARGIYVPSLATEGASIGGRPQAPILPPSAARRRASVLRYRLGGQWAVEAPLPLPVEVLPSPVKEKVRG